MSDDAISAIRKALEAGPTPGPWRVGRHLGSRSEVRLIHHDAGGRGQGVEVIEGAVSLADAAFIAACNPSAIRALLAELDAARAAPSTQQDERAAFEAWIQSIYMGSAPLAWTDERNCYDDFAVHCAWKAWQARAALKGQ